MSDVCNSLAITPNTQTLKLQRHSSCICRDRVLQVPSRAVLGASPRLPESRAIPVCTQDTFQSCSVTI